MTNEYAVINPRDQHAIRTLLHAVGLIEMACHPAFMGEEVRKALCVDELINDVRQRAAAAVLITQRGEERPFAD